MTREEDIWVCYQCEQLQGRHDQWFEGKCEKCHKEDLENE